MQCASESKISTCFSDRNDSDRRRWAFLIAYNRADNDPVYDHNFPGYTPMSKVRLQCWMLYIRLNIFLGDSQNRQTMRDFSIWPNGYTPTHVHQIHTPPKESVNFNWAEHSKVRGARVKGLPYTPLDQLNGGCGAPPTFHLAPWLLHTCLWRKCILSFWGECLRTHSTQSVH